jgi:hypothetical protein
MSILQDVTIAFTAEELLEAQGRNDGRPALIAAAEEAITMGQTLFAPAAVYDAFEVREVVGERVELAMDAASLTEGAGLTVGPKADLLAPAKLLLAAVYTIGPALETRVSELQRSGELMLAYMLDCAGVMALGQVGDRVRRLAAEQAASSHVRSGGDWGVSPSLSPGSLVGWPVQGQRELCALLPLADIGVRLNPYCVLEPHKSVSMVIGLGPGYGPHEVGSVCDYCALKDSCWRRRESE